jgi:hypothetical protein
VPAATARRRFTTADAQRFVFLLDEESGRLFEVVGVRGVVGRKTENGAAVKLLDVACDLPDDPFEALDRAAWIPIAEAEALAVVERTRQDG